MLRASALAGAGGEASRRPEMREPKRALNLPMIIGQNLTVPVAKSGPARLRRPMAATEQSASPSSWQEAGCRWVAHIQPPPLQRCQRRLDRFQRTCAMLASHARGGLMIGVLTHHWAKVDRIDEARKLLDRNGEEQSKAAGFVSRQTLIALADAAKITTLVVWTTNDIYEAWRASPQRMIAMSGADQLWARPPESERFQMVG